MSAPNVLLPARRSTSHLIPSMSRHVQRSVAATIAALMFSASIAGAQAISLPNNDAPSAPFGKSSTATYGQTFTAPNGFNYLQNFSFWLTNDLAMGLSNPSSLKFRAYVMQWDANNGHAIGPVLYSSTIQSGPTAFSQRYDFASTNTLLNGSAQYVAFLSASGLFGSIAPANATAGMESSLAGTYTGGQFVFTDNGDNFGLLTSNTWDLAGDLPEYQAHFNANFTSATVAIVPEPSSLMLLVTGFSALLVVAVKRKRV